MIIVTTDGNRLATEFRRSSVQVDRQVHAVTRTFGSLLRTRVRGKASGRPGPRAPTGDYRRSITLSVVRAGRMSIAEVGTNRPQGRRLEFGFVGEDSLGRRYNQPPYPHFGPALDGIRAEYVAALDAVVRAV